MCEGCTERLAQVWNALQEGEQHRTPDNATGRVFRIDHVEGNSLVVMTGPGGATTVSISRTGFAAALNYLCQHGHSGRNPCAIASNNNQTLAGPLCQAARAQNGGTRCINYILPILSARRVVGINGNRPNSTWLL